MRSHLSATLMAVVAVFTAATVAFSADEPAFEGARVCVKCHDSQGAAWRKTAHAKAFESLLPKTKAEVKRKAKLDPDKDYSQDAACLGCHTTGFGRPGGYALGMDPAAARQVAGVGCEACHGAGSRFRDAHGDADKNRKKSGDSTERKTLVAAGQNFDYEQACNRCHLNFDGSTHKDVKAPFSPFTPAVDAKYRFDFAKAVMGKAIHEHFKLSGVFKGEPIPAFRAELQKDAKEPDE